jgi:hypothetical protein
MSDEPESTYWWILFVPELIVLCLLVFSAVLHAGRVLLWHLFCVHRFQNYVAIATNHKELLFVLFLAGR